MVSSTWTENAGTDALEVEDINAISETEELTSTRGSFLKWNFILLGGVYSAIVTVTEFFYKYFSSIISLRLFIIIISSFALFMALLTALELRFRHHPFIGVMFTLMLPVPTVALFFYLGEPYTSVLSYAYLDMAAACGLEALFLHINIDPFRCNLFLPGIIASLFQAILFYVPYRLGKVNGETFWTVVLVAVMTSHYSLLIFKALRPNRLPLLPSAQQLAINATTMSNITIASKKLSDHLLEHGVFTSVLPFLISAVSAVFTCVSMHKLSLRKYERISGNYSQVDPLTFSEMIFISTPPLLLAVIGCHVPLPAFI